jgi:hypothetical protein
MMRGRVPLLWPMAFFCVLLLAVCERRQPLDLGYDAFDQRPGKGWRQLAEKGDFASAARLIDVYLEKHNDLGESERVNLNFHAGQMYAIADDYSTAIERFNRSTYAEEPPELPLRWNAYVQATIAFLKKDMDRLRACREEIAGGPALHGEKANLDVVERLIKHFDEPYSEAYGLISRTRH